MTFSGKMNSKVGAKYWPAAKPFATWLVASFLFRQVSSVVSTGLPAASLTGDCGTHSERWATPFEMTGEQNGPLQADGVTPIGGGITTQNTGPQPQRARIRATKAPAGLLSQPTRTIRVASRSLCTPQAPVNDAAGNPVLTTLDTCLNNDAGTLVANGLSVGQYVAPTFEFIFPENVKPGDLLVPFDG